MMFSLKSCDIVTPIAPPQTTNGECFECLPQHHSTSPLSKTEHARHAKPGSPNRSGEFASHHSPEEEGEVSKGVHTGR